MCVDKDKQKVFSPCSYLKKKTLIQNIYISDIYHQGFIKPHNACRKKKN